MSYIQVCEGISAKYPVKNIKHSQLDPFELKDLLNHSLIA